MFASDPIFLNLEVFSSIKTEIQLLKLGLFGISSGAFLPDKQYYIQVANIMAVFFRTRFLCPV